jgi:hypothetical protein
MGRRTKGDNLMADVTTPFGFPYPEDTDLVRDGATDIENLAEGVNDYLTGGYLYAGTRYYTSSGTFAKADPFGTGDIGLRAIRVRLVAGGGGGAGAGGIANRGSNGGGGGGYAESFITDISGLAATVTVTRGSGGAGGAAGDNTGTAGGGSSFGSLVTASGGDRGSNLAAGARSPGGGGVGQVGQLLIRGQGGSNPQSMSNDMTTFVQTGGAGGSSQLGGGGRSSGFGGTNAQGESGGQYGGGGAGSWPGTGPTDVAGGSGADGIVIVDCFV